MSTSDGAKELYAGLALRRLPGLDGIRAIAAFMVVVNHHDFTFVSGALGVTMFFVLSGFLITWLLLGEHDDAGVVSLRNFYIRRSLRIFPAFYAYCAIVIVLALLTSKDIVWPHAIASLFYVSNYYVAINGEVATPLSHSWSLGIEEQFYLLWPLAFLLLGGSRRRMALALTLAIAVVWLRRAALSLGGTPWTYIHYAFDTRADQLLVGCLLAVSLKAGIARRLFGSLTRSAWVSAATALLLLASVPVGRSWGTQYQQTVGFAVQPILVAALIVQVIALRDTALWRWLNWKWVGYLGTISYSTYLYQQIVPGPVMRALDGQPAFVQLAVSCMVILMLASASYWFVERPFLRMKKRFEIPRRERLTAHEESAPDPMLSGVLPR
jgi:peptidoglycan/LPS O-acetylase OafA/YrhL